MSFYAMAWAMQQSASTAAQKLLLIALADTHNEKTGQCNPCHDVLAEMTCMDRSTVIRNLAKLEATGVIEVVPDHTDAGRQTSNEYVLCGYLKRNAKDSKHTSQGSQNATHGGRRSPPPGVADCDTNLEEEPGTGSFGTGTTAARRPRRQPKERPAGKVRPVVGDDNGDGDGPAFGEYPNRVKQPASRSAPPPPPESLPPLRDTSELTPAADAADSPHRCALRFKELSIQGKKIDPANLKQFSHTLKRWYVEGLELSVLKSMVDLYAKRPEAYAPTAEVPWRGFINARSKLQEDATKVAVAANPQARYGNAYARAAERSK